MTAIHQLLHHEVSRRDNFEARKYTLMKARNPLTGEATPRYDDGEGEPAIAPEYRGFKTIRLKESPRRTGKVGNEGREESTPKQRSLQQVHSLKAKMSDMQKQLQYLDDLVAKREGLVLRSKAFNHSKPMDI